MILDVDCGNTRSKWRICDPRGQTLSSGKADSWDALLAETLAKHSVERVRISSVRNHSSLTKFVEQLETDWHLEPEFARVQRDCAGVSVAYADLTRLGVDRWLAMLAAFGDAAGAAIIVDCGTALTLDLLDQSGNHAGGYIVPGLHLAAGALTSNTGIRLKHPPGWATGPGQSTEEAVYHGVITMVVALIEKVVDAGTADDAAPVIYLTGGDAEVLLPFLDLSHREVRLKPDLVLEGLALALP